MAIHLIEQGFDCSDLHELAWEPVFTRVEAEQLFDAAAKSLGLAMPTRAQAVESILHFYATQIVERRSLPHDGLGQMMRHAYWPEVSQHQSSVYVGDGYDMQDFIGSYYSYGDLMESPNVVGFNGLYGDAALRAFDEHVIAEARRWLDRHPESEFQMQK